MTTKTAMEHFKKNLPFILVIVIFVGFVLGFTGPPSAADGPKLGQFGDSFGVLTSLFSGLGFAGVVITMWAQQRQHELEEVARLREVEEKRSFFNLEASKRAYMQARTLLGDHNNDRATWIRAGRLCEHAKELGGGVTVKEHQLDLEIAKLEYRPFFSSLIESKPGVYFYGGALDLNITEAAKAATASDEVWGGSPNRLSTLAEVSIHAIWEAGQWPKEYADPLGTRFSEQERKSLLFPTGLREYLDHTRKWFSINGELRARKNSDEEKTKEPI